MNQCILILHSFWLSPIDPTVIYSGLTEEASKYVLSNHRGQ